LNGENQPPVEQSSPDEETLEIGQLGDAEISDGGTPRQELLNFPRPPSPTKTNTHSTDLDDRKWEVFSDLTDADANLLWWHTPLLEFRGKGKRDVRGCPITGYNGPLLVQPEHQDHLEEGRVVCRRYFYRWVGAEMPPNPLIELHVNHWLKQEIWSGGECYCFLWAIAPPSFRYNFQEASPAVGGSVR